MSAPASYTYAGLGETLARAVVGGTTTLYASTPSGPLAQQVGSTTRYYVSDQHGDAVGWTDTTGVLKGTALYDPWGQVLSSTGEMATPPAQGAFGFPSDLTDASTGQVDMGVRAYEPTLGRFTSPDPLLGDPADPVSLNRYLYGGASPIGYTDPTGLMPVCGEGCTGQEEAETIRGYAASFTQTGASEYSPAVPSVAPLAEYLIAPIEDAASYLRWVGSLAETTSNMDALAWLIALLNVIPAGGDRWGGAVLTGPPGVLLHSEVRYKGEAHGFFVEAETTFDSRDSNPLAGIRLVETYYEVCFTRDCLSFAGTVPGQRRRNLSPALWDVPADASLRDYASVAVPQGLGTPVSITVTAFFEDAAGQQFMPAARADYEGPYVNGTWELAYGPLDL